jgi:hypothetical protein
MTSHEQIYKCIVMREVESDHVYRFMGMNPTTETPGWMFMMISVDE